MTKTVSEYKVDLDGGTTVEYDDGSITRFNLADTVTAVTNPVTGKVTNLTVGDRDVVADLGISSSYSYSALWASALVCASTIKVISAYSGPVIRLRRLSDSAEQDFLDIASPAGKALVSAFALGSQFRVVTLYDQTGRGNHLMQSVQAKQPKLLYRNGIPEFNCAAAAWYLDIPVSVSVMSQSATVVNVAGAQTLNTSIAPWALGLNNAYPVYPWLQPSGSGFTQFVENNTPRAFTSKTTTPSYSALSGMVYRLSASSVAVANSNGSLGTSSACTSSTLIGGAVGGKATGASSHSLFSIFGSSIDDASVASLVADMVQLGATRGLQNVVFRGDSITFGMDTNAYGENFASSVAQMISKDVQVRSLGTPSQTLEAMIAWSSAYATPWYEAAKKNVFVNFGGTNDFGINHRTAVQVQGYLTTDAAAVKAIGYKYMAATLLPTAAVAYTGTDLSEMAAFNTWLRTTAITSGIVDGVIDLAGVASLSNASDTGVFFDKLHLSSAGYRLAATPIADGLAGRGIYRSVDVCA